MFGDWFTVGAWVTVIDAESQVCGWHGEVVRICRGEPVVRFGRWRARVNPLCLRPFGSLN